MENIDTGNWYPLLDQSNAALAQAAFAVVSSDPTVVNLVTGANSTHVLNPVAAGTATITATRNSDGAVASLDVTVTQGATAAFEIHLGAAIPK